MQVFVGFSVRFDEPGRDEPDFVALLSQAGSHEVHSRRPTVGCSNMVNLPQNSLCPVKRSRPVYS
jgi:hypothetical protein